MSDILAIVLGVLGVAVFLYIALTQALFRMKNMYIEFLETQLNLILKEISKGKTNEI